MKQVSEHCQELLRQAQEEAQEELDRKSKAISELHTIEYCPLNRLKYFDDTEVSVSSGGARLFTPLGWAIGWPTLSQAL